MDTDGPWKDDSKKVADSFTFQSTRKPSSERRTTSGAEKDGSDLTTLWTTPHPSGMSTIIQDTAITSGDDFFSERTMVSFSLVAWAGDQSLIDGT